MCNTYSFIYKCLIEGHAHWGKNVVQAKCDRMKGLEPGAVCECEEETHYSGLPDEQTFRGCIGNIKCFLQASSPLPGTSLTPFSLEQNDCWARKILDALGAIPRDSSFFSLPEHEGRYVQPNDRGTYISRQRLHEMHMYYMMLSGYLQRRMMLRAQELKSSTTESTDVLWAFVSWTDAEERDFELYQQFCNKIILFGTDLFEYRLRWDIPGEERPRLLELVKPDDLDETKKDCVICYCPLGKVTVLDTGTWQEEAVKLPCGHVFGATCVARCEFRAWGVRCPYCRSRFPRGEYKFPGEEGEDRVGPGFVEVDWVGLVDWCLNEAGYAGGDES
ncbi:RING/U-box [Glarea lozoyensis ATCC 20868]|uniref:RING/U-box n=1 Tax=Glarea lozoyensis (strain ATCC 20868 / MF5171) TaxID=1116229 RepID=S3DWW1_GLAL2|nr:RING/U-box [Glarea lozoyensis ATCC 20868]EPE36436.1 RING/U-box [Glarea lozoyensis ATCC 20868]